MVILKKVLGSTLMETLIATVLIVVVFMLASLTINHLLGGAIQNSTEEIKHQMHKLQYLYEHQQIQIPFNDTYKSWDISLSNADPTTLNLQELHIKATNKQTKKTIQYHFYANP